MFMQIICTKESYQLPIQNNIDFQKITTIWLLGELTRVKVYNQIYKSTLIPKNEEQILI